MRQNQACSYGGMVGWFRLMSLSGLVVSVMAAIASAQATSLAQDLRELRDRIQNRIERLPQLKGVLINDVHPDSSGQRLGIEGLKASDQQDEQIRNEVLGILGQDPYWSERVRT